MQLWRQLGLNYKPGLGLSESGRAVDHKRAIALSLSLAGLFLDGPAAGFHNNMAATQKQKLQ